MTSYTNGWQLPKPSASDFIAGSSQNLRLAISALADKTDQGLTGAAQPALDLLDEQPVRVRETLDYSQSLDAMTSTSWNGKWVVSRNHTGPGLPEYPGITGALTVLNGPNDGYQRLDFRDNHSAYERRGQVGVWNAWQRVDSPFTFHETAPAGKALSDYLLRTTSGTYRLLESNGYPDLPAIPAGWYAGLLITFADGISAGFQIATFNNMGSTGQYAFWRAQNNSTQTVTPWHQLGTGGSGGSTDQLLLRNTTPQTYWEASQSFNFTSYQDGEHYMDWIALQHPDTIQILELGSSAQGKPIRAFQLGDPTKPALYIMAAQHGDEVMGRESVYLWVRDLLTRYMPNTWDDMCLVVTPTVNADRVTETRLTSTGTDLNRRWDTRAPGEVQAAASVFTTHDVALVVDAHEGGKFAFMEGVGPTAPEAHQALKDQVAELHTAIESAFDTASHPYDTFSGGEDIEVARNNIAATEGIPTYLFEAPSLLGDQKWSPDPAWRHDLYTLAYNTVFDHFRNNIDDYVAAKTAAQ